MGHADQPLHADAVTRSTQPRSLAEYWMPFTPNREFKRDPRMIVRAEGMYYWSDRGEKIIDGASGLFCVAAGHGRREIADAVSAQMRELDYVAPFTRGHPKQFELATRVAAMTPGDLDRIFFANSGSEAVDSAMKIALAYHQRADRAAHRSLPRAGYHGVNFGGVSLAGLVNNRRRFGPTLPGSRTAAPHLPPISRRAASPCNGAYLADDLTRFVNLYGAENIAACIVEPSRAQRGAWCPQGLSRKAGARSATSTASSSSSTRSSQASPPHG